jgi:hypothetical protein
VPTEKAEELRREIVERGRGDGAGDVDFVVKRWMEIGEEMPAEVTELVVKKRAEIEVDRGDRSDDGPRVRV